MNKKKMIGLILILVGGLLVLNNAEVIELNLAHIIFTYWPILLITTGIFNIITNPTTKKSGFILLTAGILFQLSNLEYFQISEYISFWSAAIILVGIWFIFSDSREGEKINEDSFETINLFSGSSNKLITENFQGGSSIVAFGGVDINLEKAEIKADKVQIDIFTAFGGAEIIVPEDWKVVVKGIPIFGGWDNNTSGNDDFEAPTVVINCLLLFAGFEVKN